MSLAAGCARTSGTGTHGSVASDSLETERVSGATGERMDSLLRGYAEQGFSGTVLAVRDHQIVLLKGYGFANKETRVPNSPATRYELNSFVKMFTAAGIMQLAGERKLALDDPVARHLGAFPEEKSGATIAQLASHTAGLVVAGANISGDSRDAFVSDMKRTPMESPAGTRYRYTNAGYSLLAAVLESVSGMRYEDFLRERIFKPAGMRSAVFRNAVPKGDPLFAQGYAPSPAGPVAGEPGPYVWGLIGAGGVWSAVGDVYRWVVAVEAGTVIPPAYREMLQSPPRPPSLESWGWHVYAATDTSRKRIEKGGGSEIFATQLQYFPDDRVVIIWASNDLTRRWRQTLNAELPRVLFDDAR